MAIAATEDRELAEQFHPSVGRLIVPAVRYRDGYARNYREQCSGTLISAAQSKRESDLVISAWHCLEDYRDLSRPLVFVNPEGERREARVLVSGGSMRDDWALLRLSAPLSDPTTIAPDANRTVPRGRAVTMAGYPRQDGSEISRPQVRARCAITAQRDGDTESDCILRVGASGGGVFGVDAEETYLGVISRGDSSSLSIFVPYSRFAAKLRPYL